MNREEFTKQLEQLLIDIPPGDRQDAVAYYNDYFDEAGPEKEAQVIQELGSPGKVANIIKANLADPISASEGEYTERGYRDAMNADDAQRPAKRDESQSAGKGSAKSAGWNSSAGPGGSGAAGTYRTGTNWGQTSQAVREARYRSPQQKSKMPFALLIIILIFTSPVWIGVAGGLLGVLVAILATVAAIIVGLAACGIGTVIGGIVSIVFGFVYLFSSPPGGLVIMSVGFVMLALGAIFVLGFAWLAIHLLPKFFRGFVDLCQRGLAWAGRRKEA